MVILQTSFQCILERWKLHSQKCIFTRNLLDLWSLILFLTYVVYRHSRITKYTHSRPDFKKMKCLVLLDVGLKAKRHFGIILNNLDWSQDNWCTQVPKQFRTTDEQGINIKHVKHRKVTFSALVYYSIFDHFWDAANQDMLLLPCPAINQLMSTSKAA